MKKLTITNLLLLSVITTAIGTISCGRTSENGGNRNAVSRNMEAPDIGETAPEPSKERKISKAVFYLENSGSMFGYVHDQTEYVSVVNELAEKPRFAEENTTREFYLVNGGEKLSVTKMGYNPDVLKNNLNIAGFSHGDVSKSNLNGMFKLALSKAKNDTISILISDGIYDIGKSTSPLTSIVNEGKGTRSRFIERLNQGDLQTIIIKLNSHFKGRYFPVSGGAVNLDQSRPYYIWIFGDSELLNSYFADEYLESLDGFSDVARFLKMDDRSVPYEVTTYKKIGKFRYGKGTKTRLTGVRPDRRHNKFQVYLAADFSKLPFSGSYLGTTENYTINNANFEITEILAIEDVNSIIAGLGSNPSHLIGTATSLGPWCNLEISLQNNIPKWIKETNSDNEDSIVGDSTRTLGFKYLTDAISEAYLHKYPDANIVNMKVELLK